MRPRRCRLCPQVAQSARCGSQHPGPRSRVFRASTTMTLTVRARRCPPPVPAPSPNRRGERGTPAAPPPLPPSPATSPPAVPQGASRRRRAAAAGSSAARWLGWWWERWWRRRGRRRAGVGGGGRPAPACLPDDPQPHPLARRGGMAFQEEIMLRLLRRRRALCVRSQRPGCLAGCVTTPQQRSAYTVSTFARAPPPAAALSSFAVISAMTLSTTMSSLLVVLLPHSRAPAPPRASARGARPPGGSPAPG